MTLAVLTDYAGTVLLVCWPFVDEHGRMRGSSIQNDSILRTNTTVKKMWLRLKTCGDKDLVAREDMHTQTHCQNIHLQFAFMQMLLSSKKEHIKFKSDNKTVIMKPHFSISNKCRPFYSTKILKNLSQFVKKIKQHNIDNNKKYFLTTKLACWKNVWRIYENWSNSFWKF